MMLASRGRVDDIIPLQARGYLFDLKIDGVRCIATIEGGKVTLVSRTGVAFTFQFPETEAALASAFPKGTWVLDGEIAVNDDRGLPSWPLTIKRNAQVRNTSGWASKLPATFYVFDVMTQNGQDIRAWSVVNRRQVLVEELTARATEGFRPVLSSTDGVGLWEVVENYHLEGLVAKRPGSSYHSSRRSQDWVKIKRTQTATCLVGGFDPGEGSRARTFGALHLYLVDNDQLVQVGKVGSGFSNLELSAVMHAMHHPPLIVEVEYLDISPDGLMRQPVFQRIRTDVDLDACSLEQITPGRRRR